MTLSGKPSLRVLAVAACAVMIAGCQTEAIKIKSKDTWKGTARAPFRGDDHRFQQYLYSLQDIKRQNVVMQQRDFSCGAAALATILRYHWGDNVTETQILLTAVRTLTPAEMRDRIRNGLSLTDLRRIAVKLGYLSTIGRLDFEKLRESKIPLLVGIVVNKYDHFVVVRGVSDGYVYLADPARGNVRTPIEEFKKQWQKNAVLVVVKRGVPAERQSPLLLQHDETLLGETNYNWIRKQIIDNPQVQPR